MADFKFIKYDIMISRYNDIINKEGSYGKKERRKSSYTFKNTIRTL